MEIATNSFTSRDNTSINYYYWKASNEVSFKGIVQIAHGIGEHAGRYNYIAKKLANQGFEVYANDHRIHGKSVKHIDYLGFYDGNDFFEDAVMDMKQFTDIILKKYDQQKIILFGHSLGSLLARYYVTLFPEKIKALVLSGTANFRIGLGNFGLLSTRLMSKINGKHRSNDVLKDLFFNHFNKKFKPNRTKVDWISSNPKEVDKFEADPLRIEDFSLSVYLDVLQGNKLVNEEKTFANTPTNIPIYLFSGDKDPVGEMGAGVKKVAKKFKKHGGKDITLKLYKDGRHEMLKETNKKEVVKDLLNWLHLKTG